MKEQGKKIFSYLRLPLLCMIAAVLGINIYTWNATRLTGNVVPMPFGVGAAVVLSGSMEPELSVGDLLFVAERDTYEVEDVVVYQDGGMAVTHRIIAINENEVITKHFQQVDFVVFHLETLVPVFNVPIFRKRPNAVYKFLPQLKGVINTPKQRK